MNEEVDFLHVFKKSPSFFFLQKRQFFENSKIIDFVFVFFNKKNVFLRCGQQIIFLFF